MSSLLPHNSYYQRHRHNRRCTALLTLTSNADEHKTSLHNLADNNRRQVFTWTIRRGWAALGPQMQLQPFNNQDCRRRKQPNGTQDSALLSFLFQPLFRAIDRVSWPALRKLVDFAHARPDGHVLTGQHTRSQIRSCYWRSKGGSHKAQRIHVAESAANAPGWRRGNGVTRQRFLHFGQVFWRAILCAVLLVDIAEYIMSMCVGVRTGEGGGRAMLSIDRWDQAATE